MTRIPARRTRPIIAALTLAMLIAACGERAASPPALDLIEVGHLSADGDSVDLSKFTNGSLSHTGYVAVMPVIAKSTARVAVYAPDGRLIRLLAPIGSGPGEITDRAWPLGGFGPGDSLYVQDARRQQVHVFAPPPDLRFVRTFVMPLVGGIRIGRGRLLGSGITMPVRLEPIRELSWDGQPIGVYGKPVTGPGAHRFVKTATPADPGSVWTAYEHRYGLELMRGDSVVQRVERRAEWFPDDTGAAPVAPGTAPRPQVRAISVGDSGTLWVLVTRPSPRWHTTPTCFGGPLVFGVANACDPDLDLHEGVVEAFRPSSGQLLGSSVVSGSVLGFAAPDVLWVVREDSTGVVTGHLLRASIRTGK